MKRIVSILMAISFIICMMSVLSITPSAKDGNGPCETGYSYIWIGEYASGGYSNYLFSIHNFLEAPKSLAGVSYNKATNTLTLKNANYPNYVIDIEGMGKDFTINLIGKNALAGIFAYAYGYSTCLNFTGSGSLSVNENSCIPYSCPIYISSDVSGSGISIAPSVTLSVSVSNQDYPSIGVFDTTLGNKTITGVDKNNAFEINKKQESIKVVDGIALDDYLYLYSCTPKEGSGFSSTKKYGAYHHDWWDYRNDFTIYQIVYDNTLKADVALPLYDKNGNLIDPTNFDITSNGNYVIGGEAECSYVGLTYTGTDSQFTGKVFVADLSYNSYSNSVYYYELYEVVDSEKLGKLFMSYGYSDTLPEGFSISKGSTSICDYTFVGNFVQKGTYLEKGTDGKWYYFKKGVKTKATLLFKHTDGKYYYVKNGVVDKSATKLIKHSDGKYYYVKNGVVTKSTLLFKHTDGKYYYVKKGVVTKSTILFKHTDGKYYYVKNGVVTKST
ncbi:MAG: hypothetical protein J6Z00_00520, partial [Clostridia bacterium]|nr:hypothetical protein [Clostridia bacterium]